MNWLVLVVLFNTSSAFVIIELILYYIVAERQRIENNLI